MMKKPQTANIPSTYRGSREQTPDTKFIHAMGEFIDMEEGNDYHASHFLNHMGLAAHFLVAPSGTVIQMLDINIVGAHAKGHNIGSVGIEFLVPGLHTYGSLLNTMKLSDWLTEQALESGAQLCAWLDFVGVKGWARHDETDPGRKFDPGPQFPFKPLQARTGAIIESFV